ncbi:MAG TPA: DUF1778 domain-containing protein [bacterium]|jgi:hypothetical protein|nr:DUF1778 domain-containing protein [bacterium]
MGTTAKFINIRIDENRKRALQEVAKAYGESLSEFLIKGGYERARAFAETGLKEDPFVTAMRQAASKGPKYELTEDDLKAVAASRKARARGEKDLTIAEAIKLIRKDL